jgi:hypothetical protein
MAASKKWITMWHQYVVTSDSGVKKSGGVKEKRQCQILALDVPGNACYAQTIPICP